MSGLLHRRPPAGPERCVDLLAACHQRIRAHLGVAGALAVAGGDASREAVANSAMAVERYFRLALPLHAADEDRSIAPRLRGRDRALDETLDVMTRDHESHTEDVGVLVGLAGRIALQPIALEAVRGQLGDLLARLAPTLEEHLALEEEILFPALRVLPADEDARVLAEMRARRG